MATQTNGGGTEKESAMGFLVALALVSAISGGGGWFLSSQFLAQPAPVLQEKKQPNENAEPTHESKKQDSHEGGTVKPALELVPIPPIVTNLGKPPGTYIRLEGNLLMQKDAADIHVLVAKVSEDIIALLLSLSLSELQGAGGLAHLRDDINDRVRIRSDGKAQELIINTFVME